MDKEKGLCTSNLYKVQKSDIKKCAVMLAHSFSSDGGLTRMIGDSKFNEAKMISLFRFIVKAALKYKHVYAISPEMEGLVIWLPENVTHLSTFDFFTNGGIRIILRHGFRMPLGMMKYEQFAAQHHNQHIKKPHWYLLALAVKKNHRKKGYSSMLMKPFLNYFDYNDISCYLETGDGNNEFMYRHYGFDLVEKIEDRENGGVFKAMLRNPQNSVEVAKSTQE